jgi:O-antigen ligase
MIAERRWKVLGILVLFVLAVIVIPTPGGQTLRLTRVDSTVSRIANWQESGELIIKKPILGYGFDTLRFVSRPSVQELPGLPVSRAAAGVDNSFLFLMLTSGIAGFVVYSWLLVSSVGKPKALHLAILSSVIVQSQFINSLFYPWIMLWLWMFWAASEVMEEPQKNS